MFLAYMYRDTAQGVRAHNQTDDSMVVDCERSSLGTVARDVDVACSASAEALADALAEALADPLSERPVPGGDRQ
eukprot:1649879-Prymnesium_polylepis.2